MIRNTMLKSGLALLLGILLIPSLAVAQNVTGFNGTISDSTGAVMVGVDVTVVEEAKGLEYSGVTNDVGRFEIRGILPGTYTMTAEASGFKRYQNTGVLVFDQNIRRVDITMELGELADAITVSEEGFRIDTDTPTLSYKTPSREVYYQNVQASLIYQVGAAPGAMNRNELKGMYSNNTAPIQDGILTNAYGFFRAPQEHLQEVQLKTQNVGAEFQHANNILGVGRSGTNEFHGEIFMAFDHARLKAKNRSIAERPKPETARIRWSYEGAGPVWIPGVYDGRNRTFFHANYQPVSSLRLEINNNLTYPTAQMRTGNLSEIAQFASGGMVKNPYTGTQFANNTIPTSMWHPLGTRFIELAPVPERAGVVSNMTGINENYSNDPWEHYRFDHQITDNNTITISHFRFTHVGTESKWDHGPFDCGRSGEGPNRSWSIQNSHVFSPTVINELSIGRGHQFSENYSLCNGSDLLAVLDPGGIIDFGGRSFPKGEPGAPQIIGQTIGNLSNVGGSFNPAPTCSLGGCSAGQGYGDQNNTVMLKEGVSVQSGNHLVKLGFSNIWSLNEHGGANRNSYGRWEFTGNFTGWDLGDILLGLPYKTAIATSRPPRRPRSGQLGFYLQDDWKVTSRVTISPGIRFQTYGAAHDQSGLWYNFDMASMSVVVPNNAISRVVPAYPTAKIPVVTQSAAGYPGNLFRYKNPLVQPRMGIAIRVTDTTVIRAGWGVYHVPLTPAYDIGQALNGFTSGPFELTESFGPNEIVNGTPTLTFSKAFPAPGSGSIPLQSVQVLAPKTRGEDWPSDQQWNITLEKELGNGFTGRGSYVGAKGTHWPYSVNRQTPKASTIPFTAARKVYGADPFDKITEALVGANQTYHGMEWEILRQFSSGLYMRAWYEFRTALNDVEGGKFGWVGVRGFQTENPYNRSRDKGWADGHVQHSARVMAIYDLPFGKGQKYFSDATGFQQIMLGNWTFSPIVTMNARRASTPSFGGAETPNVGRSGGRPDILPGCRASGFDGSYQGGKVVWNRACFAQPKNGKYGNATRGMLKQPRDPHFNINVFKVFPLTKYENGPYFKLEAFVTNPMNHTNPSGPNSLNINDPRFGRYAASWHTRSIIFRLRLGF